MITTYFGLTLGEAQLCLRQVASKFSVSSRQSFKTFRDLSMTIPYLPFTFPIA